MRRLILTALVCATPAFADPPLFTEGGHGGLPANAPINMQSFVKLARGLSPAVVNVVALAPPDESREGGQPGGKPRGKGQGTGFIINKGGFILTNSHVVESADDIRVRLVDERELTAKLVGRDERTDIALLKVEAGGELPVAPLGNSDELQIGEWVIAIGNPFGLDHTVTAGIVSAKGRRDVRPGGANTGYYDFIQTDASINPGNSGGPLINARGEVVGINTAMNAQAQGIGFAIPINMAKVIAPLLRQFGRAPRSWLGLYPQSMTVQLRRAFGVSDTRGALVADVVAESPADHAGLKSGDVILELDGRAIHRADDLQWLVGTRPAGTRVMMTVLRDGKTSKAEAVLQPAPDDAPAAPAAPRANGHKSQFGITVSEISPAIARELGNGNLTGVVVMLVEPESPAVEAGIERGDLILRVGDTPITSLDDYGRAVRALPHGQMLKLLCKRDGKSFWAAFVKR
jgi:serine protease Do